MTSRDAENLVFELLRFLGLTPTRVPRASSKTPDFTAADPTGGRYLVEAKTRFDSDDFRQTLAKDKAATATVGLDYDGGVEAHLEKAARQLSGLRASDTDLALVCYVLAGFNTDMQGEQLRATLWGTIKVIDLDDFTFSRPCFFLGPSAFQKHPEIDGVLAIDSNSLGVGLYPNQFSPRRIEPSFLGRALRQRQAVFSPEAAVQYASGLMADVSLDSPTDFSERLLALQRSTGRRRLSPMRSSGFQAGIRVSKDDLR